MGGDEGHLEVKGTQGGSALTFVQWAMAVVDEGICRFFPEEPFS